MTLQSSDTVVDRAERVKHSIARTGDPRAVQYWKNVDAWLGEQVERGLPPIKKVDEPGEQLSEPTPNVGDWAQDHVPVPAGK